MSPTFYEQFLRTKVICAAFLYNFWQRKLTGKIKLLVKLTTFFQTSFAQSNLIFSAMECV
jgi:hypothetical protein